MPTQASELISRLGLEPHPEGGHFRETFRDPDPANGRAFSTAILYLLTENEPVNVFRAFIGLDALEIAHVAHAGA